MRPGTKVVARIKGQGVNRLIKIPAKVRLPVGRYQLKLKDQTVKGTRYYLRKRSYRAVVKPGKTRKVRVSMGVGVDTDTLVLRGSQVKDVSADPDGEGRLVLASGVRVAKGDFIAMGVTSETPHGLLVRVVRVHGRVVTFEPADLVEVVPVGSFDLTRQLDPSNWSLRQPGVSGLKSGGVASNIAKAVTCSAAASMTVEGSVSVTSAIDFKADWGWVRLNSAELVGRLDEQASLSASVTGSAGCNLAKTAVLNRPVRFHPITFSVGPVPVVLVPSLQVYLDGEASVQAQTSTSLTQSYGLRAGMRWSRDHGIEPISDVTKTFAYNPPAASASAVAQTRLLPELSVLVYGLAGPSVNVNGGLRFDAAVPTPAGTPWWTLKAIAGAGVSMKVPALRIDKRADNVISGSWVVAQAPVARVVDQDGDGYTNDVDCNDADPAVHPGARDRPGDGIDQDCSGADGTLGTGRVQATLTWDHAADMDLHVMEPDGTHIYFGNKGPTATGGLLDWDDNVGCGTPGAVENVFWPSASAPSGSYSVWVDTYSSCSLTSWPWHLVVKVDGNVVIDQYGNGDIAPLEFTVP